MPKVLVLTGDAAESLEVMYPYQRLLEEGYEVDMAAPRRRSFSSSSTTSSRVTTRTPRSRATRGTLTSRSPTSTRPTMSRSWSRRPRTEYIRNDADAQEIIRHFFEGDAGRTALSRAARARGGGGAGRRRTAAYPDLEPDVGTAGAEFVDGAAVVDGAMVSRAWPDHPNGCASSSRC